MPPNEKSRAGVAEIVEADVGEASVPEVLRPTYGILVFQEQVLAVANAVAGWFRARESGTCRMARRYGRRA